MKTHRIAAVLTLLLAGPALAERPVVAPMKSEGAHLPRLVAFHDAKVRAKVDRLLAKHEAADRAARRDCRQQVRESGHGDDFFEYDETTEVTYVSARYVSLRVRTNYDCAGAHPDGTTEGITIDLATGDPLDWRKVFKPGFLVEGEKPSALRKLYQARYPKDGNDDPDCRDVVANGFDADFILTLDAHDGLMAEPEFPHVIQACGDALGFKAQALAPYAADKGFLADLDATVRAKK